MGGAAGLVERSGEQGRVQQQTRGQAVKPLPLEQQPLRKIQPEAVVCGGGVCSSK